MREIRIDSPMKISEIKKRFNDEFPFLKIEFFKKTHIQKQGSLRKDIIEHDFTVNPVAGVESILINGDTSVSELEQQFMDHFKLSAQVFRKSGKTWLETTYTDGWSLKKQNEEGMELSQI